MKTGRVICILENGHSQTIKVDLVLELGIELNNTNRYSAKVNKCFRRICYTNSHMTVESKEIFYTEIQL
jgi:hypothetical protein